MRKAQISCDAIDCQELIFSMGRYHCLKNRCETNGDNCMRCKFLLLYVLEERIRKERKKVTNYG